VSTLGGFVADEVRCGGLGGWVAGASPWPHVAGGR
jgi:hypothetical protein